MDLQCLKSRSSQSSRDWKSLGALKGLNGFAGARAKNPISLYPPVSKVSEGFLRCSYLVLWKSNS